MLLLNQNESHVHLPPPIRDHYLSFNQDEDICWVLVLVFTGWKRNPFFRIMPKSLAVSTCFNFLEWTCRCSFEDSCEHQETLWSSKDWTHFESRNNNPAISLVSSPFFISFLCHSAIVTSPLIVTSPPTLTRSWYWWAYPISMALTLLFLKLEIKAPCPYTKFGCLICFVFQKKARTPLGKYINPESGIMLTPLKSAERQQLRPARQEGL